MGNLRMLFILFIPVLLFPLFVIGAPLNLPGSDTLAPVPEPMFNASIRYENKTTKEPTRQCAQCVAGNFKDHRWLITTPGKFKMVWRDEWTSCSSSPPMVTCSESCTIATVEEFADRGMKFEGFIADCSDHIFASTSGLPQQNRANSSKSPNTQKRVIIQHEHRLNFTFIWNSSGITQVVVKMSILADQSSWSGSSVLWGVVYLGLLVAVVNLLRECYKCFRPRQNAANPDTAVIRHLNATNYTNSLPLIDRSLYNISDESVSMRRLVDNLEEEVGEASTMESVSNRVEDEEFNHDQEGPSTSQINSKEQENEGFEDPTNSEGHHNFTDEKQGANQTATNKKESAEYDNLAMELGENTDSEEDDVGMSSSDLELKNLV